MKPKEVQLYYEVYFKRMVILANEYVHDLDLAQGMAQDILVSLLRKKKVYPEITIIINKLTKFFTLILFYNG